MATVTPSARRVKPSRSFEVALTLEINGISYHVTPITGIQDETIERAWRLEKFGDVDAVYDVARGTDGLVTCDCPDYESRHRGLSLTGCKHCKAVVAMGLLEASRGTPLIELEPPARPAPSPAPVVEPILESSASPLPRIDGHGLTGPEFARIIAAERRAVAAYRRDTPTAGAKELDRLGALAATDCLRSVLKDRAPAPCCDSIEGAPCLVCSSVHVAILTDEESVEAIPGADPSMSPEELETLIELNTTNPDGAVEAELDRFPGWTSWPDYVSNFYWSPAAMLEEPEPEPRLTLAELVEFTARRFRALDNGFGDLMADRLDRLAREVYATSATCPDMVDARLSILDRDFTETALARDWEQPEPEIGPGGRWL